MIGRCDREIIVLDIVFLSDVMVDGINGVIVGGGYGIGLKYLVNVGDYLKIIGIDRRDGIYV